MDIGTADGNMGLQNDNRTMRRIQRCNRDRNRNVRTDRADFYLTGCGKAVCIRLSKVLRASHTARQDTWVSKGVKYHLRWGRDFDVVTYVHEFSFLFQMLKHN